MHVTLYSSPWCGDCREAKRFLTRHNIPFTEVDVTTTPGALDEIFQRTGKRAIPQFVVDGVSIQPYTPGRGFNYAEMSKLFGVEEE